HRHRPFALLQRKRKRLPAVGEVGEGQLVQERLRPRRGRPSHERGRGGGTGGAGGGCRIPGVGERCGEGGRVIGRGRHGRLGGRVRFLEGEIAALGSGVRTHRQVQAPFLVHRLCWV